MSSFIPTVHRFFSKKGSMRWRTCRGNRKILTYFTPSPTFLRHSSQKIKFFRSLLEQDSNKTPIKTVKPDNSRQNTTIHDNTRHEIGFHNIMSYIHLFFHLLKKSKTSNLSTGLSTNRKTL